MFHQFDHGAHFNKRKWVYIVSTFTVDAFFVFDIPLISPVTWCKERFGMLVHSKDIVFPPILLQFSSQQSFCNETHVLSCSVLVVVGGRYYSYRSYRPVLYCVGCRANLRIYCTLVSFEFYSCSYHKHMLSGNCNPRTLRSYPRSLHVL